VSEETSCTPKKIKLDVGQKSDLPTADFFSDFNVVKILNENAKQKCLFVHGRFGNEPDDAVLLLEKTPFSSSTISDLLRNKVTVEVSLKNDRYKTLELCPTVPYSGKIVVGNIDCTHCCDLCTQMVRAHFTNQRLSVKLLQKSHSSGCGSFISHIHRPPRNGFMQCRCLSMRARYQISKAMQPTGSQFATCTTAPSLCTYTE